MSEEQLKAFLERVKGDSGLREGLRAATDIDAVVAIARAAGFAISVDDLKQAQAEVSDKELEGVAGGRTVDFPQTAHVMIRGKLGPQDICNQ